uniref:Uncharacterized protein n=1 Tax=Acrobeloides nanus TaxID=290746 RepID=A0A914DBV7_9BILA
MKNVEEEKNLKDRYSIRESLKKRKNCRASSLTRLFGDMKSFLTTSSFENEHRSRCMELNSMSRFHRSPSLSPNVKFRNRFPTNEKDKFLNFEDEPKVLTPPDMEKSPGFSNSRFIIEEIKKTDKNEDLSTNSTDKKLTENYVAHRPSLVAFQRNHCGFVRQRVNLFDTSAGFNTSDLNRSLACERIVPQNLPSLSAHQGLKELPADFGL